MYFNRLRCHLNDGKYKDIEKIISDIEKSELEHNKRVAELTKNLKADIRNDIYAKDIRSNSACNSEALKEINEVSPTYEPHFILDQIIQYYIDKVNGIKTSMKVWQPDQETFQLAWEAGFRTAAGRGDEKTMKWLLDKIESSPIPQKLMRLQTEGNRINDLVNVKLKSRIKDLSVEIGDGRLAGKCDFECQ